MLRSALTSRSLAILAAGFLVSQTVACTPSASSGGSGGSSSSSGGSNGSGGNKGSGGSSGSGGSGSGSGGHVGSGGSGSSSGGSTGSGGNKGSGGSTGSGGSGTTGSGGSGTTGSGGSGTTGSGGSGTTGSGGSGTTGSGGSGTTGSGGSGMAGGSNGNPNCPADGSIISDFEEGTTATTINPKGGVWNGYVGMGSMTPTPVTASMTPTGIATDPGSGTCMGSLHIKATGATDYSGFGATLAPAPKSGMFSFGNAVDVSSHKGIKFKIKSGSGTPPAVYFDIKTKETSPMSEGGNLSDATSNNNDSTIGLRNNRGQMLVSPWTTPSIGSDWATITVPFGTLIPRWVPAAGSSMACPAPGTGVAPCQAPRFVPADVLGIEFSILPDPGFPKPSGSTVGTYDLWVDDVAWVDDDSGLPPQTGFPLSGAGSVGMCNKPTGADGKFLVTAYDLWKQTFAKNGAGPVIRPEAANDVVSEGIAYGMLIAVNMNDKTTFDNLYTYWKGHAVSGTNLMTWCQPSTGGGTGTACSAQGGGSATDADEDAAFALIQAAKVFSTSSYMTDAATMIGQIWSKDIDGGSNLPTGGSNYGSTSSMVTNPSYFAPAYYRVFASMDSGHAWGTVADNSISAINALSNSNGLVSAWCSNNCKSVASNGGTNDMIYQYDAHRVPMRVGLDYCWNGTSGAQQFVMKNTAFFATNAHAGKDGIGRILDLYNLDSGGTSPSSAEPNSASIIGTAAVGAMASKSNQGFLDDAYQAVFDMVTRATLAPVSSNMTPYSYYNATVGMLTLLIMTGNFSH